MATKKLIKTLDGVTYSPLMAQRELVLSDLYEFVKYFWDTFEPFPFTEAEYIEFLCECVTFMSLNKLPKWLTDKFISEKKYQKIKNEYFEKTGVMPVCDIRDKMFGGEHVRNHNINIHPRAGKSLIVNVCEPVWSMLHSPITTTSVSHSQDLSREFIDKKRKLLNSEKFRIMFPEDGFRLVYDSSTLVEMQNFGRSYSVSMRAFTGRGSDCFVGGTLVMLSSGSSKCIEDCVVGDRILSFNHDTKLYEEDEIVATREVYCDRVTEIRTDTGVIIGSTSDHRYWLEQRGYTEVCKIKEGEELKGAPSLSDLWDSMFGYTGILSKVCREISEFEPVSEVRCLFERSEQELCGTIQRYFGTGESRSVLHSEMCECAFEANLSERDKDLCSLWKEVITLGREVLFNSVQARLGNQEYTNSDKKVQELWGRLRSIFTFYCNLLQQIVLKQMAVEDSCWREKCKLEGGSFDRLLEGLGSSPAGCLEIGKLFMLPLWCKNVRDIAYRTWKAFQKNKSVCSSCGWEQEEQLPREFISTLQKMSQYTAHPRVLAKSVRKRRCCVYDIQTKINHNFFANGILVHNCILNDDLCNVQDARADGKVLQSAKDYIRFTQSTRLNDPKTGITVHIMQRICKGDVSDMITSDPDLSKLYSNTILRALAVEEEAFIFPVSGRIWHRKKGDPLAAKRFGDYSLERMKLGEIDFECQFQQNVALSGVNVVSLADIKENTISQDEFENVLKLTHYASHDCPVKDKESSDFHGYVEAWADDFGSLYITDALMERMAFSKEEQFMINLETIDPSILQVVEDKANGSILLQQLAGTLAGLIPFEPGTRSKMARLELAVVYLRQKRVKFVKSERVDALCMHLTQFPTVHNDDDVDAFSQLVLCHFTQKDLFIYSGVFSSMNIVHSVHETEYEVNYYGVTESDGTYRAIKIRHDQTKDIFTVCEECRFNSMSELADFLKKLQPGTMLYDCSVNQQILNVTQYVFGLYAFDDIDILLSTSIVKGGFAKNKIQVLSSCTNTILDVMRWRTPNKEFNNLPTDYDIRSERLARCIRGVVTMVKGNSNFWL